MKRLSAIACLAITFVFTFAHPAAADPESRFADVNGVHMHYLVSGKGSPVVLLDGYAETAHMWLPLIKELEKNHTVIAPDLRGADDSSTPPDVYTKIVMAQDVHALVQASSSVRSNQSVMISV